MTDDVEALRLESGEDHHSLTLSSQHRATHSKIIVDKQGIMHARSKGGGEKSAGGGGGGGRGAPQSNHDSRRDNQWRATTYLATAALDVGINNVDRSLIPRRIQLGGIRLQDLVQKLPWARSMGLIASTTPEP